MTQKKIHLLLILNFVDNIKQYYSVMNATHTVHGTHVIDCGQDASMKLGPFWYVALCQTFRPKNLGSCGKNY